MSMTSPRQSAGLLLLVSALVLIPAPQAVAAGRDHAAYGRVKLLAEQRGIRGNTKCGFNAIATLMADRKSLSAGDNELLLSLSLRPVMQKSIVSPAGHFRIHYDTTGIDAPSLIIHAPSGDSLLPGTADAYADSVAAFFDYSWQREVNEMGYPPPPPDAGLGGDDRYDIYIQDEQDYGSTTPDTQTSQTSSSSISLDNDFIESQFHSKGLEGAKVTAAHEFFHAIQMGDYRVPGLTNETPFFYEISSTWMEDEVYPQVKDYLYYLGGSVGSFSNTAIPLNLTNGVVEYGRAVFAKYLSKLYGAAIIKDVWTAAAAVPTLPAIVQTLQTYHTSLEAEYPEYALWYYYTGPRADPARYFPDGALYPDVRIYDRITFVPPLSQSSYTSRQLAFQYYQVTNGDTATLLATNVDVNAALALDTRLFPFSYTVRNDNTDGGTVLSNGWSVIFQAADPENWKSTVIFHAVPPVDTDVNPFPNPLIADGESVVAFPIPATAATGELNI